jgi:hypothetical protein
MDRNQLFDWQQENRWDQRIGKRLYDDIQTKLELAGLARSSIAYNLVDIYSTAPEYDYQIDSLSQVTPGDYGSVSDILVCMKQNVMKHVNWHINYLFKKKDNIITPFSDSGATFQKLPDKPEATSTDIGNDEKSESIQNVIDALGMPNAPANLGKQILYLSVVLHAYVGLVDKLLASEFENKQSVFGWVLEVKGFLSKLRKDIYPLLKLVDKVLEYCGEIHEQNITPEDILRAQKTDEKWHTFLKSASEHPPAYNRH